MIQVPGSVGRAYQVVLTRGRTEARDSTERVGLKFGNPLSIH